MFENKELRRIFGLRRQEIRAEWRKLPDGAILIMLLTMSCQADQTRGMRWVAETARTEETRNAHKSLSGNIKRRDHFGDSGTDGMIILSRVLVSATVNNYEFWI
jgi:hypothetical protein